MLDNMFDNMFVNVLPNRGGILKSLVEHLLVSVSRPTNAPGTLRHVIEQVENMRITIIASKYK